MEILFELIIELLLEGSIEIGTNHKISGWIRYPVLTILFLFYTAIIFGIIFIGILLVKENVLAAFMFIGLGLFLLIASIYKIKKFKKI